MTDWIFNGQKMGSQVDATLSAAVTARSSSITLDAATVAALFPNGPGTGYIAGRKFFFQTVSGNTLGGIVWEPAGWTGTIAAGPVQVGVQYVTNDPLIEQEMAVMQRMYGAGVTGPAAQVQGFRQAVNSQSGNYTPTPGDSVVKVTATSGTSIVTLPKATGSGQRYTIVKVDSSSNHVTVHAASGDTLGGSGTDISSQYGSVEVLDVGAGLYVVV
jgi:hypothetical protein